jgi:hypothetical protein
LWEGGREREEREREPRRFALFGLLQITSCVHALQVLV